MASGAESFWDSFYDQNSTDEVSSFFKEYAPRLQKGKILDIGCGTGAQTHVLAGDHQNTVKGIDISGLALEKAQGIAQDKGLSVEYKKTDLDLFLFGLMEYDSIVVSFFKPALTRYYSEIIRALKQGGTLFLESYLNQEMTEFIPPEENYKDFYYKPNEVLKSIKDLRILYYREDLIEGKHRVQCFAQKYMDKDAAKLGLFNMQSKGAEKDGPSKQRELAEALFKKK